MTLILESQVNGVPLSIATMSEHSYDYPPTFVEHRPANYGSTAHLNRMALGKLRHHFFVSRLSGALRMVLDPIQQVTAYHRLGFRAAIVSNSPAKERINHFIYRNMS